MSNPLFDQWVREAFEKVAWPHNPENVAKNSPRRVAKNIRAGGRIIDEMGRMVPEAAGVARAVGDKVLAPAGKGAVRAMRSVGDHFRKNPKLMRLGVGTAVAGPILWGTASTSQKKYERELMALHNDPSRTITASLDAFLEKQAKNDDNKPFSYTPGDVTNRFNHVPQSIGAYGIKSFTQGIGEGVGKGLADMLFRGLGGLANSVKENVSTNPRRAALVDSLIRTDPVISDAVTRDPHGREALMEAYGTMVRFAPSLSTDINAVRSFLREAVLSGSGVNYATIKNLIETERALNSGQEH